MNKRNGKFFASLLFAAFIHGGALILAPDIFPAAEQQGVEPQIPPVLVSLSPPLPEREIPPVPPSSGPPEAAEPPSPVPAADSGQESPPEFPPDLPAAVQPDTPGESPPEDPVVWAAAEPEGAGNPLPDPAVPTGAALVSEDKPKIPAAAEPPDRGELLLQYEGMIRLLIDRHKEYPYQARRQDQEGRVGVRFVLSRRGELVGEPVLDKKSRYRLLNASALEAVKRAIPYPPFPPEFPEEELVFSVTLAFSLSGSGF